MDDNTMAVIVAAILFLFILGMFLIDALFGKKDENGEKPTFAAGLESYQQKPGCLGKILKFIAYVIVIIIAVIVIKFL